MSDRENFQVRIATNQFNYICDTKLEAVSVDVCTTTGSEIWAEGPAVCLVVNRPTSVKSQEQAANLWALKPEIDRIARVNLVCVLHKEHDLKDVAEFKRYWPGPLYIDSENSFYEALEKGERWGGCQVFDLWGCFNPTGNLWAHCMAHHEVSNKDREVHEEEAYDQEEGSERSFYANEHDDSWHEVLQRWQSQLTEGGLMVIHPGYTGVQYAVWTGDR
mmetsp:Transcript_24549/g.41050  ORF Transcript_24549/g.41050 Transcript_24549/m.41050 type:complete len:218 (+) Transcript_24549:120-773(+)|eukprot:CAMPEP_0198208138 /NCGR_PEP_ID=MMETSP1445-20131203/11535_1 /TAXON_ID=36898 /ORGANISM="Pyramimonas sp., Strain CCMP2087" /LENGTH=217 /DNA_ID=CAMNT_0043881421 /DNA_START=99 /DNA_END=752 /DNA_ORIENTATION=-